MDTNVVGRSWDMLGDRQMDMLETFYSRLFEQFPQYRDLFPDAMDRQMKKMARTMATVSRLADSPETVEASMVHVGEKHRHYGLRESDLQHFEQLFISVLAEYCGETWSDSCARAWDEAFATVIKPMMMRGMARG